MHGSQITPTQSQANEHLYLFCWIKFMFYWWHIHDSYSVNVSTCDITHSDSTLTISAWVGIDVTRQTYEVAHAIPLLCYFLQMMCTCCCDHKLHCWSKEVYTKFCMVNLFTVNLTVCSQVQTYQSWANIMCISKTQMSVELWWKLSPGWSLLVIAITDNLTSAKFIQQKRTKISCMLHVFKNDTLHCDCATNTTL